MDNTELVKRLRANTEKYPGFQNLNTEAADTIERLERELAEARDREGRWTEIMADETAETMRLMVALDVLAEVQGGRSCMDAMLGKIASQRAELIAARKVVEVARGAVGPCERCGLIWVADELRSTLTEYDKETKCEK